MQTNFIVVMYQGNVGERDWGWLYYYYCIDIYYAILQHVMGVFYCEILYFFAIYNLA